MKSHEQIAAAEKKRNDSADRLPAIIGLTIGLTILTLMIITVVVFFVTNSPVTKSDDFSETSQAIAKDISVEARTAVREIFDLARSEYDFGYIDIVIHEATKDVGVESGPWGEYQFEGISCYLTARLVTSVSVISESCYRVSDIEKAGTTISYHIFNHVRSGEKSIF